MEKKQPHFSDAMVKETDPPETVVIVEDDFGAPTLSTIAEEVRHHGHGSRDTLALMRPVLTPLDLVPKEDELRVSHRVIAERAGLRPDNLLRILKRLEAEDLAFGTLLTTEERKQGARGATEELTRWLTEEQTLIALMEARSPAAYALRRSVVKVFLAVRNGELEQHLLARVDATVQEKLKLAVNQMMTISADVETLKLLQEQDRASVNRRFDITLRAMKEESQEHVDSVADLRGRFGRLQLSMAQAKTSAPSDVVQAPAPLPRKVQAMSYDELVFECRRRGMCLDGLTARRQAARGQMMRALHNGLTRLSPPANNILNPTPSLSVRRVFRYAMPHWFSYRLNRRYCEDRLADGLARLRAAGFVEPDSDEPSDKGLEYAQLRSGKWTYDQGLASLLT